MLALLIASGFPSTFANEVSIVSADLQQGQDGTWSLDIGLLHEDNGWDHYADIWRVVDEQGNVLGERVLLHPHDNEQPFVRGADGVEIPHGAIIYIEAHDLVHGWTPHRLAVDLSKAENGRLMVLPTD